MNLGKAFFITSLMASYPAIAFGQNFNLFEEVGKCTKLPQAQQKACFDKVSGVLNSVWTVTPKVDLDKGTTTKLLQKAQENNETAVNKMSLGFTCENGRVQAIVIAGTYIGAKAKVRYQFDKSAPLDETWNSDGSTQIFLAPRSRDFINKALQSNKLIFQFEAIGPTTGRATFDLSGLPSEIHSITSICAL